MQASSQQDYLKMMIQQTRKGNTKMTKYLVLMKSFVENLNLKDSRVETKELISYVVAGLDEEYTPIVVVIQNKPMSWNEVQSQLLAFEKGLEQLQAKKCTISIAQPSSNLTSTNVQQTNTFHQQSRYTHQTYQRNYCGRGRGRSSGSKLICQVCCKTDHIVAVCYHRFENNFNNAQNAGESSSNANSQTKGNNSTTLIATLKHPRDTTWYLDSGASNHLIVDLANLNLKTEYVGNEMITVGNGTQLPICYVGSLTEEIVPVSCQINL